MVSSRLLPILLIMLIICTSACSRGENSQQTNRQKRNSSKSFAKLSARILPDEPTAADDLRVVFSGTGNLTYRWEKNGELIAGENGPTLARKLYSKGDRITVHIAAHGVEESASLTILNAPPLVESVAVEPETICRGVDITASPQGFDADGDPIRYSYRWVINGEEQPEDSQVLKGERFNSGERVSVKVTPIDDESEGKEYATQAFTIPNCAPYFISTPPTTFEGNRYTYEAKARDPDGDAISYSLVSAPQGMTINGNTGRIEWTVTKLTRNYDIEIEAKDDKGLATRQKYTLSINIK